MSSIRSFDRYIHYVKQRVEKVYTDPSTGKKALQLSTKLLSAYDLYTGNEYAPDLRHNMKGTIELIEFYGSFKNIMFWINPFSKKSMDQDLLTKSLEAALLAQPILQNGGTEISQGLAKIILTEVMQQENYSNTEEVRAAIEDALQEYSFNEGEAVRIARTVQIQNKSRSFVAVLSTACFTIVDLTGNALTLQRWGIVNLSHLTAELGNRAPIFALITKIGAERVMGILAVGGLTLLFGDAALRSGKAFYYVIVNRPNGMNRLPKKEEERKKAVQEMKAALFEMATVGVQLGAAAVPLFFTLNPATALGLGIFAKSTGLFCALM